MESWRERSIKRKREQATDPKRVLHRGIFRGERRKGRKARLDELMQAWKEFHYDLDRYEEAKGRHAEFVRRYGDRATALPFRPWPDLESSRKYLNRSRKRYLGLLARCERDGLI